MNPKRAVHRNKKNDYQKIFAAHSTVYIPKLYNFCEIFHIYLPNLILGNMSFQKLHFWKKCVSLIEITYVNFW